MEEYVIDRKVKFLPSEQVLIDIQSGTRAPLSLIASEILCMLVVRRGQSVTRETLFSDILYSHGAASTNNNLNQYILNLRKQLTQLGLTTEIIQTLPRIGFTIPASIQIEISQPGAVGSVSLSVAAADKTGYSAGEKLWLGLMAIILVLAGFLHWKENHAEATWDGFPDAKAALINNAKNCPVYAIPSSINQYSDSADMLGTVEKAFGPLDCRSNSAYRYYLFENLVDKDKYRIWVLRCSGKDNDQVCFSRYSSVEKS